MNPDLIETLIGHGWKLILAATVPFSVFLFRKQVGALIERLTRLKVKRGNTEIELEQVTSAELALKSPDPSQPPEVTDGEDSVPQLLPAPPDASELFFQMMNAFSAGDIDAANTAYNQLVTIPTSTAEQRSNQAIYLFLRFKHASDSDALDRLATLARHPTLDPEIMTWLAEAYRLAKRYADAEAVYRETVDALEDRDAAAEHIVGISQLYVDQDRGAEALSILRDSLATASPGKGTATLWKQVAEVAKHTKDGRLKALALEKLAQANPTDARALFNAAYAESNADMGLVATENYLTVLRVDPTHSMAENNLAVKCAELDMPFRAVRYYRSAAERDNTLSMANIANSFMKSGFDTEATEILQRAQSVEDTHANVARAVTALDKRKKAEAVTWSKVTSAATKQQRFVRHYADRFCVRTFPAAHLGTWIIDGVETSSLDRSNGWHSMTWGDGNKNQKLSFQFDGPAAEAIAKRWQSYLTTGSDGFWSDDGAGLAFLADDGSRLEVMVLDDVEPRYLTFLKK